MSHSRLPAFIVQKAKLKPSKLQKARQDKRELGDVGTPEIHKRMMVQKEVRERTANGQPRVYGGRVKDQTPIDRYFLRGQLDPDKQRNYILFQAAERLRTDFYYSGLQAHTTSSFEPRVSSGIVDKTANLRVDCLKKYKTAVNSISQTLRPVLIRVCLDEEAANTWAIHNGQSSESGIVVLRLALQELAHHYGLIKLS